MLDSDTGPSSLRKLNWKRSVQCVCVCLRMRVFCSTLTDSASWQDGSGSMAAVLFNVSCSQPQLLQMRVNIAGGPFHSGLALSHTLSVSSSPYDTGWEDTSLPLSPSLHLWETVKESVCPLRSGLGDRVSVNVVLQRKNTNKNRPWKYADCWHRLLCIYWSASVFVWSEICLLADGLHNKQLCRNGAW